MTVFDAWQNKADELPMKVTGYRCVVCGEFHRAYSSQFLRHMRRNADHYGWRLLPKENP